LDEHRSGGALRAVAVRRVESVEAAEREEFLGSPTLRINGEGVDLSAAERRDYGLKCRLYPSYEGLRGAPPEEWLLVALTRASERR
jgi:hypothetical protein